MNNSTQQNQRDDIARDELADWLRDAHAMEMQAETMLKGQAKRLENYPEVKARIEQHVTETQQQARDVQQCLKSLGEDTSAMKDAGAKTMAMIQAMGGMTMSDEVIKGAIASYAFEHVEVATYTVLIAAAQAAGESNIAQTCERILEQEKSMASWLDEHTPALVRKYLERKRSGQQAKR